MRIDLEVWNKREARHLEYVSNNVVVVVGVHGRCPCQELFRSCSHSRQPLNQFGYWFRDSSSVSSFDQKQSCGEYDYLRWGCTR